MTIAALAADLQRPPTNGRTGLVGLDGRDRALTGLFYRLRTLVDRGQVDLAHIRLAAVMSWVLAFFRRRGGGSVGELCTVLEAAVQLALLKARRLAGLANPPSSGDAPPADGFGLAPELALRRRWLAQQIAAGPRCWAGPARTYDGVAPPLVPVEAERLRSALIGVLARQPPPPAAVEPAFPRVSVQECSILILEQLARGGELTLREVAGETRDARVAALLACLLLVRQDRAAVVQEELFGEILIRSSPAALEATA